MRITILRKATTLWGAEAAAFFPFDRSQDYPAEMLYEMRGTIVSYLKNFVYRQRNTRQILGKRYSIKEQERVITVGTDRKYSVLFAVVFSDDVPKDGTCAICGCSNYNACYHPEHGSCWWVLDEDHRILCSHCAIPEIANAPQTRHKIRG